MLFEYNQLVRYAAENTQLAEFGKKAKTVFFVTLILLVFEFLLFIYFIRLGKHEFSRHMTFYFLTVCFILIIAQKGLNSSVAGAFKTQLTNAAFTSSVTDSNFIPSIQSAISLLGKIMTWVILLASLVWVYICLLDFLLAILLDTVGDYVVGLIPI